MNHRRPHPGFTLIELLVVVAIIALLMGILLPTLGQVRRIAQRAVCAVSAKGLVQANAFYAADHGDHYVLAAEDMLTDRAERFLAAELVREQVLRRTHQEVPYGVAVDIEEFAEKADGDDLFNDANIIVERDGQKGIVIGKGGRMLGEIGSAARHELAQFFGRRVELRTYVKV